MTMLERSLPSQDWLQSDPHAFRDAMRRLAGGVSVITVGTGTERTGLVATSVTSLSAEPPSLLFCLNREASSWPVLERYKAFAVNFVHEGQRAVADRFAGMGGAKGVARYEGAKWSTLVTGAPILTGALAALDCIVEEFIHRHSHVIVIGRVVATHTNDIAAPLVYWNGGYVDGAGI